MNPSRKPLTHIGDLVPDPANRRKHNPRNIGMISDALREVGAARSIVIDENDVILAGNGLTDAAAEAGITKVQVVEADGETIIAVRRRGLTEEQKRALAIYDNRTAELAEWNPEQLAADQAAGLDLQPWFTEAELAKATRGLVKVGLTDPDEVPEERPTGIVAGDLFDLGRHRLLCGDCTDAGIVGRLLAGIVPELVLTDPPYGLNIVKGFNTGHVGGGGRAGAQYPFRGSGRGPTESAAPAFGKVEGPGLVQPRQYRPVHGDDQAFDPTWLLGYGLHQIIFGANYFASKLPDGKTWITWDKNVHGNFSECELAWTSHIGRLRLYRHTWSGLLREGPRDEELADRVHPTQKPVGLLAQILEDFTESDQTIFDPYLGSGSTMIACERMTRRCVGIEIDPHYCQVIIDRWEAFTGHKAEKLGEVVTA